MHEDSPLERSAIYTSVFEENDRFSRGVCMHTKMVTNNTWFNVEDWTNFELFIHKLEFRNENETNFVEQAASLLLQNQSFAKTNVPKEGFKNEKIESFSSNMPAL